MKPSTLLGIALFGLAADPAVAQCSGTPLTAVQIQSIIGGKLVCGRPGTAYPGGAASADRWQEEHGPGNQLWDFKKGADTMDPRKQVGSWSTVAGSKTNPSTITHQYSGSVGFTWVVYGPDPNVPGTSVYSFCTTGSSSVEHVRAYVKDINAAGCGNSYP